MSIRVPRIKIDKSENISRRSGGLKPLSKVKAKVDTNIGRKKKENQKPGKPVKGLRKGQNGPSTLVTLGYPHPHPRESLDGVGKKYEGFGEDEPKYDTVSLDFVNRK